MKATATINKKYKGIALKDTRYCKSGIDKDAIKRKHVIIPNRNSKRGEV